MPHDSRRFHVPGRLNWILHKQGLLLALIGFMVVAFLFQQTSSPWWFQWMCVPGRVTEAWEELKNGQADLAGVTSFLPLFSSVLLHGGIEHLLYNMLALWIFGALVSDLLGQRWLLLVFAATALGGSVCHVAFNHESMVPCLGASGAVMGMEGAYLGLAVRFLLPHPQVWPMTRPVPPAHLAGLAVFGIVMDYTGIMDRSAAGIAYGAHIGGFTTGLFLAALLAPLPKAARPR